MDNGTERLRILHIKPTGNRGFDVCIALVLLFGSNYLFAAAAQFFLQAVLLAWKPTAMNISWRHVTV